MKHMVILRGIPGSGKSTYQREHFPDAFVVSSDHFFVKEGVYRFDHTKLGEAHRACFRACLEAVVISESPLIVVDNTNLRAVEVAPYVVLGEAFGYEVEVITLLTNPVIAAARNVHGVPEDSVLKMARRLEMELLPLWWKQDVVTEVPPSELGGGWSTMRHSWDSGDTCRRCGLHREAAGVGPYGSLRFWRDDETGYKDRPGECQPKEAKREESPVEVAQRMMVAKVTELGGCKATERRCTWGARYRSEPLRDS